MEIFMELYKALCEISGEGNVLKDEPMKSIRHFALADRQIILFSRRR